MRHSCRYAWIAGCLGLMALAAASFGSASAQEDPSKYPTRAIHIVVGFTPGGGNDIIARIVGQKLSESLGQPVIIDNKPGGGAIVATEYVAKSAPDGYTLLVGASGAMAINPAVYAKLPYDSIRDFVPVSELGSFPLILIVNASSPIKSVADLVAFAKANPDKTNYSSSSAAFQLVTELFKQKTGAPMQDDSLQGRQRFGDGRDLRPGDRDHRRRRSGIRPGATAVRCARSRLRRRNGRKTCRTFRP